MELECRAIPPTYGANLSASIQCKCNKGVILVSWMMSSLWVREELCLFGYTTSTSAPRVVACMILNAISLKKLCVFMACVQAKTLFTT
jgi:hypothetical protein